MSGANIGIRSNPPPITRDLTLAYALSLIVAIIMTFASVVGVAYRTVIYPTGELLQSFVPNDVVNLVIGVPILLGSVWSARRGQLIGLLCWPGALFYVLYTYIPYLFGVPFNVLFLAYLTLVALSVYTTIGLVASIDGDVVREQLAGVVPARATGGILAGLAVAYTLRVVGIVLTALTDDVPTVPGELPVLVADFMITPAWLAGGVLLWRRKALGYVAGMGLFFQSSMLFVALIVYLSLQPLMTASVFRVIDTVVVFVMGLICFVPFALFVRGVVSNPSSSSTQ